ncbi:MAG: SDR family NAD(P)-dependent oxidoreductase [Planctomycetia bacterium]
MTMSHTDDSGPQAAAGRSPAHGRVALVTGASAGIGTAVALELSARGYAVGIVGRDALRLEEVRRGLESAGGRVLALCGDLGDLAFAESVVRQVAAAFGRLDVLVNNAAARELKTMREMTPAEWDRTIRVCLTSPAFMARWAAEEMERHGGGVIVNVGSMMSRQAHGVSAAYVSCKGAMESLTYDLAALYGPVGIRVVTLAPGAIDTAMSSTLTKPAAADDGAATDPIREFSESMAMLGRWGRPEEVAKTVAWIASDEASYLTGTTLVLDGGWSRMHMPPAITQAILQNAAGG